METGHLGIKVVLIEPGDHRTAFTANRRKVAVSEPYKERFQQAISRMEKDEQDGPDPANVAKLIGRIVDMPSPRLRYTVGPAPERAMVWLKRAMPYSAIKTIMRSITPGHHYTDADHDQRQTQPIPYPFNPPFPRKTKPVPQR